MATSQLICNADQLNGFHMMGILALNRLHMNDLMIWKIFGLLVGDIKQKGKSQTGVTWKRSLPNFPKNEHFLSPDTHTCVCVSEGKKCSFFGKFGVSLRFLVIPVLRFITDEFSFSIFIYVHFQKVNIINSLNAKSCHHIETIQLIYKANHLCVFYTMATLAFNGFICGVSANIL